MDENGKENVPQKEEKTGRTFWDFASEMKASYDRSAHPEWFETPEETEERKFKQRIKLVTCLALLIFFYGIMWFLYLFLTR
ncbi:hypothetical protein [uncultured Dubosiella sp.]|uniref:hypothetical protein n=1 Tax=uncultured Dubosiella sp. TaxID=1937011 RepID=UPI002586545B|nr:hypothetical protein [uncultured Dubosiella sp.]